MPTSADIGCNLFDASLFLSGPAQRSVKETTGKWKFHPCSWRGDSARPSRAFAFPHACLRIDAQPVCMHACGSAWCDRLRFFSFLFSSPPTPLLLSLFLKYIYLLCLGNISAHVSWSSSPTKSNNCRCNLVCWPSPCGYPDTTGAASRHCVHLISTGYR